MYVEGMLFNVCVTPIYEILSCCEVIHVLQKNLKLLTNDSTVMSVHCRAQTRGGGKHAKTEEASPAVRRPCICCSSLNKSKLCDLHWWTEAQRVTRHEVYKARLGRPQRYEECLFFFA